MLELLAQNIGGAHFEPRIERHLHVARAVEDSPHGGILRIVSMAQERNELAVIVAQNALGGMRFRILDFDQSRTVVVAAQAARGIALDERRVARGPAGARAEVAQEIEEQAAEGIVARFVARAGAVDIDAELLVVGAMLFEFGPIAGGEGEAVAVVDAAHGDLAHHELEAGIVLVAAGAIGLDYERALAHGGVGVEDLDVGGFGEDEGGGGGEDDAEGCERRLRLNSAGRRGLRHSGPRRYLPRCG